MKKKKKKFPEFVSVGVEERRSWEALSFTELRDGGREGSATVVPGPV